MYIQKCLAMFCNNPPQGRGEENGLTNPIGSEGEREEDAGANMASFLQAAADQTSSIALAVGKAEGA